MTGSLLWNNFLVYSLQIGLLVAAAALVPAALRMRSARGRLLFWHALLAGCLLIPLLQPWRSEVVTATVSVATGPAVVVATAPAHRGWFMGRHINLGEIAAIVLLAGCLVRLTWLTIGLCKLRRYRRNSLPLEPAPAWSVEADLRLSPEIASPVTFGLRKPVVLLPADFCEFDADQQEAILCHEILHVRRRDWLFMLMEELIRAAFWFHPAIWWLLGEIQLSREQTVDRAVVDITKAREPYVDALLAVAGANLQMDLAPAPLFLRKRHLKYRVVSILKERPMSRARTAATLAAGLAMLCTICFLVTSALPLWAAPQTINDAAGVSVDTQGARLLHRAPVDYPRDAQLQGVEGVVVAQVKLDSGGNVSDASILSGPDALRKPVLQSLLNWHFTKDAAGGERQIAVTFREPSPAPRATAVQIVELPSISGPLPGGALRSDAPVVRAVRTLRPAPPDETVSVQSIELIGMGVPEEEFLAKLPPLHVHLRIPPQELSGFVQAVHRLDEHLIVGVFPTDAASNFVVRIAAPGAPPPQPPVEKAAAPVPDFIPVGGGVQNQKLIYHPDPVYPQIAKSARISGTVELKALIAPDGRIRELRVISGHPLLRQAALDAVKQWVYAPTLLNEQPVSVSTTVDIIFSLSQ